MALAHGGTSALTASQVSKNYRRNIVALAKVDLAIPTGSITALLGPNGAGKSTLIRLWLGFERPSEGSVAVLGVDPRVSPVVVQRAIGYVPQRPFLYRELSIRDHLDLACSLRPSFDRGLAEARLADLGLTLTARVEHLSGGESAQVALSLAVATRAPILLLDEPLASMDPLSRREFLGVLAETTRTTGRTVVLSSHVVGDVEQAANRIVIVGAGRLLLSAAVDEVLMSHVVGNGVVADEAIGTFPDLVGGRVSLAHRSNACAGHLRPATLEEVVLGYLAAGRAERLVERK